jgi:DNA polymerase-3 subunit delta'
MIAGTAPHAIVIAGPSGVGKTTLALDLAAGLLCGAPAPEDRPCRECRGCRLVERGSHADLHVLRPAGPGNQIRIGDRSDPEPGTVRRLIAELALLPVEGGARVALVEQADRLNDEAQSALLKTLEEPPSGVTIVLCADHEDRLLPTVRSRCVRIRLGPVAIRDVEAILAEQGAADAPTAARLARLAAGRPGLARTWALAPEAVIARGEIARSLLDLASAGPARRLSVGKELLARAADLAKALEVAALPTSAGDEPVTKRGRRGAGRGRSGGATPAPPAAESGSGSADEAGGGDPAAGEDVDGEGASGRDARAPATERRRAAAGLLAIWRDVARDLVLVSLGEERRLRDPAILDDLRAAGLPVDDVRAFMARLDRTAELLEGNVSPELAIDSLVLAWPQAERAA